MAMPDIIDDIARHMRLREELGWRRYHLLLVRQPDMEYSAKGYRALARLIKENYFSTILTIGCEDALERALTDLGIRPPVYKMLFVGQDADESVIDALDGEETTICIVVLDHLNLQEQAAQEESITTPNSSIPSLAPEIWAGLQYYLNQEIVIAGSIEHETALLLAFQPQKENTIYYIPPAEEALQHRLSVILDRQGKRPIFMPEPYNTFDAFFEALSFQLTSHDSHAERQIAPSIKPIAAVPGTPSIPSSQPRRKKMKVDLLLVTTTPVETEAVLAQAAKKSRVDIHDRAYHDLDLIGRARTFLVQSPTMGFGGSGGSLKTIEAAIQALSPWAVIMVGIAFGFDPANQRIGDILISQQIQDYDPERVGSDPGNQLRGVRVNASASLLNSFFTNQHYIFEDWPNPPKIHPGLILSGSKLVDNEDFRDHLRMAAPNAVGGEMEGMGLYEAASNKHVEWLLVKAISDWADGNKHINKKEHQQLATSYVARFTIKVIELGGFTRPSRR